VSRRSKGFGNGSRACSGKISKTNRFQPQEAILNKSPNKINLAKAFVLSVLEREEAARMKQLSERTVSEQWE